MSNIENLKSITKSNKFKSEIEKLSRPEILIRLKSDGLNNMKLIKLMSHFFFSEQDELSSFYNELSTMVFDKYNGDENEREQFTGNI